MTTGTVESPPGPAAVKSVGGRGLVEVVLRAREISIAGALIVLVLATTIANPRFMSAQGVKDITQDESFGQKRVTFTGPEGDMMEAIADRAGLDLGEHLCDLGRAFRRTVVKFLL